MLFYIKGMIDLIFVGWVEQKPNPTLAEVQSGVLGFVPQPNLR
jgi:hypothetical protein